MKVVPIVAPQIDWFNYITETQQSIGRSPTRSLDRAGIVVGNFQSFLQSLGEFQFSDTNPVPYLRSTQVDPVLDMLSFVFLVQADDSIIMEVLKYTRVNILATADRVDTLMMSGTLRQWRDTIRAALNPNPVLAEIRNYLIRWGLRELVDGS